MEHILDIVAQRNQLITVFEKIKNGNTILFLGAGASVGERKYLSNDIIEYYEQYLGKDIFEPDITKFVDILEADPEFSRKHFDHEIERYLKKYSINNAHKIIAAIQWREIITSNFDVLVEHAYDDLFKESKSEFELYVVRNSKEYDFRTDNTQIKLIKLNGCVSDKGKYPFIISTDDFNSVSKYYKNVLNSLKSISHRINFLSVGYTYKDIFGVKLLEKFDSFGFREKRWMYNVDPYPNESILHYYTKNKVCIIKLSCEEFFSEYKKWEEESLESTIKIKGLRFSSSKNSIIQVPNKLAINLDGIIEQLNSSTRNPYIKDVDFYKGEEPNYSLILRDVDVVKTKSLKICILHITNEVQNNQESFPPLFFIKGDFGIGKTTFTLRLIHELVKSDDDTIALNLLNISKLRSEYLIQLINLARSKNIVLYCDEVEVESSIKELIELQRQLSIEQFNDINLFFIIPIRENILEKYKKERKFKNIHEIKIESKLEKEEAVELLEKLKNSNLITYRDITERNEILRKIEKKYDSDTFVSLLDIITSGNHVNDLISAFKQLSEIAQKAFLYTAALHRFKLAIPAPWLKQILNTNWDDFIDKVIKVEGKGLLIQTNIKSYGIEPDLFFKTKHPIIAEKIIEKLFPNNEKQFQLYEKILKAVEIGDANTRIVINLLKHLSKENFFSEAKINSLYSFAYNKLSLDPYYLLQYATNLQYIGTEKDLKKGLEILIDADSLLRKRNHRFIHRRGVINFELAKFYYAKENELNYTLTYLQEAEELLLVKQKMDPCSRYSYIDYLKLLIWQLDNIELDPDEELQLKIKIDEIYDLAIKTVNEGIEIIEQIYSDYISLANTLSNALNYKEHLIELYKDPTLRPFACILLFNLSEREQSSDRLTDEQKALIEELETYKDKDDVVRFLFKFYGRRVYIPDYRVKFFLLCREHQNLETDKPIRFYYFNFIAESYNGYFSDGKNFLKNIKTNFHTLNPEFHYLYRELDGSVRYFEGIVVKDFRQKYKAIKISELQQTFRLIKGTYEDLNIGSLVQVKLHFYLYGIMAEVVKGEIKT